MTNEPAHLNVLISGGFAGAYEKLLPEFMRTSGIKVATGSGASQGTGPQTIAAQLARGVPADVVILSREGLNELIAANRIAAGTDVDLAQVPLGVAVRAGTATPDVSTVEAFRQILLNAKTVAVPASTSGIWLMNDLFPRLGIVEKIDVKMGPRGSDAAGMVAAGMAAARGHARQRNRATHRASRAPAASRRRFSSCRYFRPPSWPASAASEASKQLIAFLASAHGSEAIKNSGMEPLAFAVRG